MSEHTWIRKRTAEVESATGEKFHLTIGERDDGGCYFVACKKPSANESHADEFLDFYLTEPLDELSKGNFEVTPTPV